MLKGLVVVSLLATLVAIHMIGLTLCEDHFLIGLLIGFSPEIILIIYLLGMLSECNEADIGGFQPTRKKNVKKSY